MSDTTKPPSSGELNWLAQQRYGRMYGALTPEEREKLTSPGYDRPFTEEEETIMQPPPVPAEWTAERIFSPRTKSEVDFVIRACNCHDDLVAALKALLSDNLGPQIDDGANWDACCDMAKAALAKAGEK